MHIILGGTGHIGAALAQVLLECGEPVTIVTRSESKRAAWERKGARVEVADVHDVARLRSIFAKGTRAYLLNPPASPESDSALEERRTVRAILAALEGAPLTKVVAESTYGAQPGEQLGDLGVLYELEQGLKRQPIPASVIRGAYYYSNWEMSLETARSEGRIDAFYPADFVLPMVAPRDIAQLAAKLLREPSAHSELHFIEGPRRYTPRDVANAFSRALGKPVSVAVIPESKWISSLQSFGFSPRAAASMAAMTHITLEKPELPAQPVRGATSLQAYIDELVGRGAASTSLP